MNHLTSSIRSLALYLSVKIIIYSLFVLPILFIPMISHADVIFVWHPVDGSLSSGILTIDAPVSGGFSVPPTAVTSYKFSFGPGLTVNLNNAQPLISNASIVSFGGSSLDGGVFDLRLLEDPSIDVFNTFLDSGTDVSQYDPSSQNIVVRGNWLRADNLSSGLELINTKVNFVVQSTSLSSTPVSGGPAGVYTITAQLTNKSQQNILEPIQAAVTRLTNGNKLLSATEGEGDEYSKQAIEAGTDNILQPNESVTVQFRIGLANRNRFIFLVDIWGTAMEDN